MKGAEIGLLVASIVLLISLIVASVLGATTKKQERVCQQDKAACATQKASCDSNYSTCDAAKTTCQSQKASCDSNYSACDAAKTTCQSQKATCDSNYSSCDAARTTCQSQKASCDTNYSTCQSQKASCDSNYSACQSQKASCDSQKSACLSDKDTCNANLNRYVNVYYDNTCKSCENSVYDPASLCLDVVPDVIAVGRSSSQNGLIALSKAPSLMSSWTPITPATMPAVFDNAVYAVAYNGLPPGSQKYVAVGSNTGGTKTKTIIYSYDGASWTQAKGFTFSGEGDCVCFNKSLNRWVAGGFSGYKQNLAYSTDGETWTACINTTPGEVTLDIAKVNGVACNGQVWVAVGECSQTGVSLCYSEDNAVTWAPVNSAITTIYSVAYVGDRFVAASPSGFLLSADGKAWSLDGNVQRDIRGIASKPSKIIAASSTGLLYSVDKGVSWGPITLDPTIQNEWLSVTFAGGKRWFAGKSGNMPGLYYSQDDGATWVYVTTTQSGLTMQSIHGIVTTFSNPVY